MTKELRNEAHERVNGIHEARRSREVAAEQARPKPAVPQPGMSPSQELEEMMQREGEEEEDEDEDLMEHWGYN